MKIKINQFLHRFGVKLIRIEKRTREVAKPTLDKKANIKGRNIPTLYEGLPFAGETLQYLIEKYQFNTILDIGSGEGKHSDVLSEVGKQVTSIDFGKSVYFEKRTERHTCIFGDYYTYNFEEKFDAIWASHVLEHQPNPNLFLRKIHKDLKEGGVLAITVPPLKHEIVGGHVTLWNAGLLMYQLILAGFDCSEISIKTYGYNISVILKKKSIKSLPDLDFDSGDIIRLKQFFPGGTTEPFNGDIKDLNWGI